jgi:hypothetical protein
MAVNAYLWTSLKKFTNDEDRLSIEAKNIGELVGILEKDFPGLKPFIDSGISFTIYGKGNTTIYKGFQSWEIFLQDTH